MARDLLWGTSCPMGTSRPAVPSPGEAAAVTLSRLSQASPGGWFRFLPWGARVSRVRPGRTGGALRCAHQSGICLTFPFLGLRVGLELGATARGGGCFLRSGQD